MNTKSLKLKPGSLTVLFGVGLIVAFLFVATAGPQIGQKLGKLSEKKQTQESQAVLDNPPTIDYFYSSKTYVSTNLEQYTLNWKTNFAGFCNGSGAWSGRKGANGSEPLLASTNQTNPTYTLTCYGANSRNVTKSIVVMNPNIRPPSGQGGNLSPCNPYGDIDHNGFVNAVDSQLVLQIVAQLPNAPKAAHEIERADVDDTANTASTVNDVTAVDSLKIQRLIAGLDKTFPVCN